MVIAKAGGRVGRPRTGLPEPLKFPIGDRQTNYVFEISASINAGDLQRAEGGEWEWGVCVRVCSTR